MRAGLPVCVRLMKLTLSADHRIVDGAYAAQFLAELERDFTVLPIDREVAIRAATLPAAFPRDPMDRLIAGTALAHDLTLITADGNIRGANACRWLW